MSGVQAKSTQESRQSCVTRAQARSTTAKAGSFSALHRVALTTFLPRSIATREKSSLTSVCEWNSSTTCTRYQRLNSSIPSRLCEGYVPASANGRLSAAECTEFNPENPQKATYIARELAPLSPIVKRFDIYQTPSIILTSSEAIVFGSQGGSQTIFTSTSSTPGIWLTTW